MTKTKISYTIALWFGIIASVCAIGIPVFFLMALASLFLGNMEAAVTFFIGMGIFTVVGIPCYILMIAATPYDIHIPQVQNSSPPVSKIDRTDKDCNGTGRCKYCRGTGEAGWNGLTGNGTRCPICIGTGVCHVCQGKGVR